MGPEGIRILDTFPLSDDDRRKNLVEILCLFDVHFVSEENIAYERSKFYSRNQVFDETIDKIITALRTISRSCKFIKDMKDFTHQMIRHRIICGISNESLHQELLSRGDISL